MCVLCILASVCVQDSVQSGVSSVAAASGSGDSSTIPASVIDVDLGTLDAEALLARTEAILGVDWELQQEIFRDMLKSEKKYRVYNQEVSSTSAPPEKFEFACDILCRRCICSSTQACTHETHASLSPFVCLCVFSLSLSPSFCCLSVYLSVYLSMCVCFVSFPRQSIRSTVASSLIGCVK